MKILFASTSWCPLEWQPTRGKGLPLSRRASSSRSLARQVSAASSFHGDKVVAQTGQGENRGTVGNYGCGILGRVGNFEVG